MAPTEIIMLILIVAYFALIFTLLYYIIYNILCGMLPIRKRGITKMNFKTGDMVEINFVEMYKDGYSLNSYLSDLFQSDDLVVIATGENMTLLRGSNKYTKSIFRCFVGTRHLKLKKSSEVVIYNELQYV